MMKPTYSIPAIFVCLGLIFSFILTSCAGETLKYLSTNLERISYKLDNDKMEAMATGYYVKDGNVLTAIMLPEYVEVGKNQFKVVSITDRAFISGLWISVTIGSYIKTVGNEAFADCKNIKTVKVEGINLPLLPDNAFEPPVYDNANLIISSEVNIKGIGWEKFTNVSKL